MESTEEKFFTMFDEIESGFFIINFQNTGKLLLCNCTMPQ